MPVPRRKVATRLPYVLTAHPPSPHVFLAPRPRCRGTLPCEALLSCRAPYHIARCARVSLRRLQLATMRLPACGCAAMFKYAHGACPSHKPLFRCSAASAVLPSRPPSRRVVVCCPSPKASCCDALRNVVMPPPAAPHSALCVRLAPALRSATARPALLRHAASPTRCALRSTNVFGLSRGWALISACRTPVQQTLTRARVQTRITLIHAHSLRRRQFIRFAHAAWRLGGAEVG